MQRRKSRWPTDEEIEENLKKHIIDDTTDAVPPYGLEKWEIEGTPAPKKEAKKQVEPAA